MSASTSFYTPIEQIPKIHTRAWQAWRTGKTKSVAWRKEEIAQLGYMIKDNEQRIKDSLRIDLGRPEHETEFFDFSAVYIDIKLAYDNLEEWTKTEKPAFNLTFSAMRPQMRAEPKGAVLLIAPFNFPVALILGPLVGAIAAGNAVVIKPSEQTPAYSALLAELVPQYLDPDLVQVVNGGVPETTALLERDWGHIFYIGNARVGRIIAAAAAKHLTPVTLELGGQNPVVVDPKCNLKTTARRILWGRFSNAGQICLCPDYVLVPEEFQDKLATAFTEVYHEFYPEGPANSESFGRIVTEGHAARLQKLLEKTRGSVVFGGDSDVSARYVAPTLIRDVRMDDPLLEDELFGPILSLVPVKSIDDAIACINSKAPPLAVYVFSQDKAFQKKIFDNTRSGSAVANETLLCAGVPGLPIGGVGASGYGYFSGKFMFDQFTHLRASIDSPTWLDKVGLGLRYPPYSKSKMAIRLLAPSLPARPQRKRQDGSLQNEGWSVWLAVTLVGVASFMLKLTGPGRLLLSQLKE
ncbi:NAD-dependent aldehyde dehydrogenase [Trametes meyenii]|nr:NAD-dependent aldehyde dehydrogenase [Trametes meyenii]